MSSNLIPYLNAVSKCVNACALHLGVRLNRQTASLQYNRSSRRHCTTNTHTFLTGSLETKSETLGSRCWAWLCVCVRICLLCFSHLWGWIMCLCVCLATCRDGNYCDMMGPQRDGVLHFILSLSLNHVFSSSHNRVRSLLRSPSFFVFLHFYFFFSLTAELNELVSYRAREWASVCVLAESELKSTADTLNVSDITSQQSTFEKYQENLTGTSQPL